jgi:hypothetical protein
MSTNHLQADPVRLPPAHSLSPPAPPRSHPLPPASQAVLFGGVPRQQHIKLLEDEKPCIVVGTPGRIMDLVEAGSLKLDKVREGGREGGRQAGGGQAGGATARGERGGVGAQ